MPSWQLKLLYDGECPYCRREVEWLSRRNQSGRLAFEDISALGFDPGHHGLTREEVTQVLHAVRPDGTIFRRVEAIRQAYRTVGLGWLVAPTGWPVLRTITDCLYGCLLATECRWVD